MHHARQESLSTDHAGHGGGLRNVFATAGLVLSAGLAAASLAAGGPGCCPEMAKDECGDKAAAGCGEAMVAAKAGHCDALPAGMVAQESRANSFTHSLQERAALATDPKTGHTLVVWESRRQEMKTYGVVGQTYDALGRLVGTEIGINETLPGAQFEPAVAIGADGTAWVTWQSDRQDGDGAGIYARQFKRSCCGTFKPAGGEFAVNATSEGNQLDPSIAINEAGQALIVWHSDTKNEHPRAMARLFNADGTPAGDEIELSEGTRWDRSATAAATRDNGFVVLWDRVDEENQSARIHARLVAANGEPAENTVQISPESELFDLRWHIEPSVDVDENGNIVAAWLRTSDDQTSYDVLAQRLSAEGQLEGDAIVVSKSDGNWQNGASVSVANDGRFMVAYTVHGEPYFDVESKKAIKPSTIYAQRFTAEGEADGSRFRVNQGETGLHELASSNSSKVTWGPHDQFAFAWQGAVEGDGSGIGLTVIAPDSVNIDAPAAVERVASNADLGVTDIKVPPERNLDWDGDAPRDPVIAAGPDYGFQAYTTTEWQPPDPDLAVGPDHIVAVVNMRIKIFDKDGNELFHEYLEDFWGSLGADYFVFDPVAQYDPHADRFVVVSAEHRSGNSSNSYLDVAVSQTSDPTQGWHKYSFSVSSIGTFLDFENLGIGTDAYYVSADYFGGTGNVIHIMEKTPMLNGNPVSLDWVNTTGSIISLGSTDTFDSNAPAQYFASAFYGSTEVRLMAITDPLGNPTLHQRSVPVTFFSTPPDAAQRGSSNRISTVDERIKHGVYRDGSLYLGHAIGQNSTARVRWYEIEMNGWPTSGNNPSLAQEGTINLGSGQHSWFQDIGVDADGDIVIVANRSSSADYPFVSRFVQKAGDPADSLRTESRLVDSTGAHTGGRFGDYAGVDEDPAEPGVFWSHHEYNEGTGTNWRTWVGRVDSDQSMVLTVPALIRGQNANIVCDGAKANGTVFLGYSVQGTGTTYVAPLDVTLDLQNPKQAAKTTANSSGTASFNVPVPANIGTFPVWLQAAEMKNTSNVVQENIQ